jgi:hypothetical protein
MEGCGSCDEDVDMCGQDLEDVEFVEFCGRIWKDVEGVEGRGRMLKDIEGFGRMWNDVEA